jgi:hypothetical protein
MAKPSRKRDGIRNARQILRRMRASLTEDRKLRDFREIFGRDPADDCELDHFIEEWTLEMYNGGCDVLPDEEGP